MRILIIFNDRSLGGTSRSAIVASLAWKRLGHEVFFNCQLPLHESRRAAFADAAAEYVSIEEAASIKFDLIHIHYSNYSEENHAVLMKAIRTFNRQPLSTALIVNNIFGAPDRIFLNWRGPRAIAVLGLWARYQYLYSGLKCTREPFIVPNAQDCDFFRLPTDKEREEARRQLNLGDKRVVFRLGSPYMGKWSMSYVSLAERLEQDGALMMLAGAPPQLLERLAGRANVLDLGYLDSDLKIRAAYWASDVLALDASRGESFGNVITESLLSGLPVVYRAREFRDNTPWELRNIPGFTYATGQHKFLAAACSHLLTREQASAGREEVARRYGVHSVGATLTRVANGLIAGRFDGTSTEPARTRYDQLPFGKRLKIAATHNPLVAVAKQLKLRLDVIRGHNVAKR